MREYTVVVAEDEPWIRRSIVRKINSSPLPFRVVGESDDGERAAVMVRELGPDLLVTDIRMPERTGIEIAAELKEAFPVLQVIIVTGYDEFAYARQAIRTGVVDYLIKPVDQSDLDGALTRAKDALGLEFAAADSRIDQGTSHGRSADDVVSGVRRYVLAHITESMTVGQIAQALGYSSDHLTRLVEKRIGSTCSRYIAELRVREAMRLLRAHPHMQISEIGPLVGLPDPAQFSRTFKRVSGTSPAYYRDNPTNG